MKLFLLLESRHEKQLLKQRLGNGYTTLVGITRTIQRTFTSMVMSVKTWWLIEVNSCNKWPVYDLGLQCMKDKIWTKLFRQYSHQMFPNLFQLLTTNQFFTPMMESSRPGVQQKKTSSSASHKGSVFMRVSLSVNQLGVFVFRRRRKLQTICFLRTTDFCIPKLVLLCIRAPIEMAGGQTKIL